jgi:hypothetical protein
VGRYTWIKLYADKWLDGTIREETPAVRAAFVDLLALAGSGRYGEAGVIKLARNIGLQDAQVAAVMEIPIDDWLAAKGRLIDSERIIVDSESNIISICNWRKYQSEYQRTKPYKKHKGVRP